MYLVKFISDFKIITSHVLKTDLISKFSYVLVYNKIEFYRNKYLIKFESKVYYLQHHQLRNFKREYYILTNTGYDIDRNNKDIYKENRLQTILIDIAVNQINFFKQLLAIILLG